MNMNRGNPAGACRHPVALLLPVMAAVSALLTPQVALAQEANPNPAPNVQLIDPMGVDMTSGRIRYIGGVLAIGDADRPALSTNWFSYNIGVTGATPLGGSGYSEYVCLYSTPTGCAGIGAMHYKLGDRVVLDVTLKKYGGDVSGNVVTEPDGTQWTFAPYSSASPPYLGTNPNAKMASVLQSVRYPDGEQLTFTYSEGRTIRAVVSSRGYMLHLTPGTANGWSRAVMLNLRYDYCDPTAANCTPTSSKSLVATAAGAGGTTTVTDPAGRIARLTTASGNGVSWTAYTPEGRWLSWTEKLLGVTQICPSGASVTTQASTAAGAWNYAYTFGANFCNNGVAPDLVATDPLGGTTTMKGNGTQHVDALGRLSKYGWFLLGSTRDQVTGGSAPVDTIPPSSATGGTLADAYGSLYKPSMIVAPEGDRTEYTYDGRWNVIKTERKPKPGSDLPSIITSATYRACSGAADFKICNQPQTTTDADGQVTTYTYDPASGKVATVTYPAIETPMGTVQPRTRFEHSPLYAVYRQAAGAAPTAAPAPIYKLTRKSSCLTMTLDSCVGSADEVVTTYGYTENLQLAWTTTAAGDGSKSSTVSYVYDSLGDLVSQTGPLPGQLTRHFYDAARQRYATVGPDPDGSGPSGAPVTWTTFDRDGLPTSVRTGYSMTGDLADFVAMNEIRMTYDGAKRKVLQESYVEGVLTTRTSFSYDAMNHPTCTTQRMNLTAGVPSDACVARTAGTQGPDRITRHTHDAAGQLKEVRQAVGTTLERVERAQTFTANGKLATIADANGNLTTTTYDGFDRPLRTQYPHPTLTGTSNENDYEEVQLYDAASRPLVRRLRDGNLMTFAYDASGRNTLRQVTPQAWGEAADTRYTYDIEGRLRVASDNNGWNVTRVYDALGCKTSEQDAFGTKRIDCDVAGQPVQLTYADGFQVRYEHRLDDQFARVDEVGGAALMSYGYDAFGRQRSVTRGNGVVSTVEFSPGSAGPTAIAHVIPGAAVKFQLVFNAAGQVTQLARDNGVYGRPDVMTGTMDYGVNGLNQMTLVAGTSTSHDGRGNLTQTQGRNWSYTLLNRLATADGANLLYDAMGRLVQIQKGGVSTRFEYMGESLIAERDENNAVLRRFVPGRTADDPLLWYEGVGTATRRWMHVDQQGSVIAVTDAGGALVGIDRYDEYGMPAPGNVGRHQYTGQLWLPELGLYYYKARMYHPGLGRFLQTDPVGYASGDLNLYAYVGNDPVNRADPSGLTCEIQTREDKTKQWSCRIDTVDGKELTDGLRKRLSKDDRKFIENLETEMTGDFHKLISADPSRQIKVDVPGTLLDAFTFSMGEISKLYKDAKVNLDTKTKTSSAAQSEGPDVRIFRSGFNANSAHSVLHETIHATRDAVLARNAYRGNPNASPQYDPARHNAAFDTAIRQMLK